MSNCHARLRDKTTCGDPAHKVKVFAIGTLEVRVPLCRAHSDEVERQPRKPVEPSLPRPRSLFGQIFGGE